MRAEAEEQVNGKTVGVLTVVTRHRGHDYSTQYEFTTRCKGVRLARSLTGRRDRWLEQEIMRLTNVPYSRRRRHPPPSYYPPPPRYHPLMPAPAEIAPEPA